MVEKWKEALDKVRLGGVSTNGSIQNFLLH